MLSRQELWMMKTVPIAILISVTLILASATDSGVCAESPHMSVDRSIIGITLGSTFEEVRKILPIEEREDSVASLLLKYISPQRADERKQINKIIRRSFYTLPAPYAQFLEGVTSADFEFFEGVLYQVGLHYSESYVKQVGWRGFTAPYIGKYGEPVSDAPSQYRWSNGRTRLEIDYSGDIINVFYTDLPLNRRVEEAELSAKDFLSRQR
jgi:hypothetical protein